MYIPNSQQTLLKTHGLFQHFYSTVDWSSNVICIFVLMRINIYRLLKISETKLEMEQLKSLLKKAVLSLVKEVPTKIHTFNRYNTSL